MSFLVFPHLGYVGRLGNALFQFAATYGLARTNNAVPCFNEDWIHRPYFSVPDSFFAPDPRGVLVDSLLTHIDPRARIYMQDVNLFEKYLPEIREYLRPSARAEEIMNEYGPLGEYSIAHDFDQLKRPILSVHVRRGDNVPGQDPGVPDKHNYYVLPPLEYYQRAIESQMNAHPEIASVAIFSDEPEWCEWNFPWATYIHSGQPRPKEHEPDFLTAPVLDWIDLQLMANCQHHIVTGSTFGIWGALLADSASVIRPSPVYGPFLEHVDEDLMFPAAWQRLELATC